MPEFWPDADSLIESHRGPYRFETLPQFWDFLEEKAKDGMIASPEIILDKELSADPDDEQDVLEKWAKELRGIMFLGPNEAVQNAYKEVVNYVQNNGKYRPYWVAKFLDGADPLLIAYAKALGGRIVTFETRQPEAKKPKIPDVAEYFGVACINLYDMLTEMNAKF